MAKYQPEKQYTNHALMDEIVYNTEIILQDFVVKNQVYADIYETQDTVDSAEIYKYCKSGSITFDIFPFTEEILIEYGITDDEDIKNYLFNRYNIPVEIRNDLLSFSSNYYIENFVEKNLYYRALMGLAPLDQIPDEYIYITESLFPKKYWNQLLEKSNYDTYSYNLVNSIKSGNLLIQDLDDYNIAILENNGIINKIIEENKSKGIRFEYLWHLGYKKIDLIKARNAHKWDILYITDKVEKLVKDRFVELYNINREIFLTRIYQDAYAFDSDYYDELCIIMLISQTFNDLVVDIPEWYIRRDIFDIRSVQYFLEAYGVKYFKRIPLKYQIKIVKNLNKLIKYKSSDYNFKDILELFEVPDTKIYKYYLFKNAVDYDNPELEFIQTEIGDIYDNYIKDNSNRTPYDEITYADQYWDGQDTHGYIKALTLEKDFTIERTKYYSIDYEVNIGEYAFQSSYFINLLFSGLNTDDIKIKVTSINSEVKFKLSDLFLLISCFNLSYFDLDTSVKIPEYEGKIEKPDEYYIDYNGGYSAEKYEGVREEILQECYPLFLQKQELEDSMYKAFEYQMTRIKDSEGNDFNYTSDDQITYPVYYNKIVYNQEEVDQYKYLINDIDNRIDEILKYSESDDYIRMLDGSLGEDIAIDNYFQGILRPYGEDGKYITDDGLILWDGCYVTSDKKVYSSIEEFEDIEGKKPWEGMLVRIEDNYALLEGGKFSQLTLIDLTKATYNKNVEWNEKFLSADGGDPSTYNNVNEEDFYHWMKKYYSGLYKDMVKDRVVGFNMDADLNWLQDILNQAHSKFHYSKGWTLKDLGVDKFINNTKINLNTEYENGKIPDLEELINIYHNNRECYEALQYKLLYEAETMDEYRVFKFVFEYLFTIPRENIERFEYNDLEEMLLSRDYLLYEYYKKIDDISNIENRRDNIQLALDQIIDTLEYYLKNHDIDYVLSNSAISSFFSIVTYLKFMLDFFKSYKIQFLDPYNTYIIDNKYSVDGSGDGQYHRAKDVITETEIQDHYQDKHFIKDVPPYTEIELNLYEFPYHNLIKEKMDLIGHFEPNPFDDYDYNGMSPEDEDNNYKDANGGKEYKDAPIESYFMLDGSKPQLLMKNFWDLNGGNPVEMIDYLNIDGGRSFDPDEVMDKENHFYIQDDYENGRFNPKSIEFNYIIDAGSSSTNTFVTKTIITRVIDRQISQELRLSKKQNNEIKIDENGELYLSQKWVSWDEFSYWEDLAEETFETSGELVDDIYYLLGLVKDDANKLVDTIDEERDKLLYGLETTLNNMNGNNFENRLKAYTDEKNDSLIDSFNEFNPFDWVSY